VNCTGWVAARRFVLNDWCHQGPIDDAPPRYPHLRYTLSAGSLYYIHAPRNPSGVPTPMATPRPASTQKQKKRILAGFAELLMGLAPWAAIGTPAARGKPEHYQASEAAG